MSRMVLMLCTVAVLGSSVAAQQAAPALSFSEQNETLFHQLQTVHGLSADQMSAVREIFTRSGFIGQGNPLVAHHPVTPEECSTHLRAKNITYERPKFDAICGARYMAPLFDPASESAGDAKTCIDRFEFPDIPCAYPVVWVRAKEAAELCTAVGKRLCDAHEWEGACAGALKAPDYRFDLAEGRDTAAAVRLMREAHNRHFATEKSWSYGPQYQNGVCAAASKKTEGCDGGGWQRCGSNTYPAGFFPECRSPLDVYDLHGNAAEHMSLPLAPEQMASRGSREIGVTEMKGSWFIFDHYRAHEDWCRWRAPFWHGTRVMDPASHHNYHLGFRCCKSLGGGE